MKKTTEDRLKDQDIQRGFRYLGLVFLLVTGGLAILGTGNDRWLYLILMWTVFLALITLYRFYAFRKIHNNFEHVLEEYQGSIKEGSFLFAVPPSLKFKFHDKTCFVIPTVDPKLDHVIEFVCLMEKEIELRIQPSRNKGKDDGKDDFLKMFTVGGKDRRLIQAVLKDSEHRRLVEELLAEFPSLLLGRDGRMHLVAAYDSRLTQPRKLQTVFQKMLRLAHFFEFHGEQMA